MSEDLPHPVAFILSRNGPDGAGPSRETVKATRGCRHPCCCAGRDPLRRVHFWQSGYGHGPDGAGPSRHINTGFINTINAGFITPFFLPNPLKNQAARTCWSGTG